MSQAVPQVARDESRIGEQPTNSNIFSRVPPEIMHEIFRHLSVIDMASFAVSYKNVYACYLSYPRRHGTYASSILFRSKVLPRIQDERWAFCDKCYLLHPRPSWKSPPAGSDYHQRPLLNSGKLDVCPCFSLSFPETRLKEIEKHECYIFNNDVAQVTLSSSLVLGGPTECSNVVNSYSFVFPPENWDHQSFRYFPLHKDSGQIRDWLKRFLGDKSKLFRDDSSRALCFCDPVCCDPGRLQHIIIGVVRPLGYDVWPDERWIQSCHD